MPARKSVKKEENQIDEEVKKVKKLKIAERERLIQWWRACGWTYERITAKFKEGITEKEYEEIIARIEAA